MARRPLAAAMIVGASALVLTGCIPLPPAIPAGPTAAPVDPAESSSDAPSEPATGAYDFTVDDQAGDTWSYSVTGLEENPPLDAGEAAAGSYLVAVLFDAAHVEGAASFSTCFDVLVVGSDGQQYDWADAAATAQNDLAINFEDEIVDGRALVQLPDGVTPAQIVVRSSFGYPEVADTVIDVQ